jgi:hypothetical protein
MSGGFGEVLLVGEIFRLKGDDVSSWHTSAKPMARKRMTASHSTGDPNNGSKQWPQWGIFTHTPRRQPSAAERRNLPFA